MDIYLDHNANSPVTSGVVDALVEALESGATNPGSGHARAYRARELLEEARRTIARGLSVRPSEILFTSGGTESNNLAIVGLYEARSPKNRVVTAATEHPSVSRTTEALRSTGADVVVLEVDADGRVDPEALASAVDERTALVTLMLANNETGVLHDIARLAEICAGADVPLHCDAVQAIGKIPVSFRDLGVASASFTAHKLGGPIGIGGLFIRKGVDIRPQLRGGSQERGLRPGTQPFALAHCFARAVEIALDRLDVMAARVGPLRDQLEARLKTAVPGAIVMGGAAPRLPNTSLVTLPGYDAGDLMASLDERGIRVGTGSACGTRDRKPSHVVTAMGFSTAQAHGTLRFSLSSWTTAEEMATATEALFKILER